MKKNNYAFIKTFKIEIFFCLIIIAVYFLHAIFRKFHPDEIEHIHASWYIHRGFVPFKDFFEHHHSFIWYINAFLIDLFGENKKALYGIKALFFLNLAAIWFVSTLISNTIFENKKKVILAVFFAVCTPFYIERMHEVRPDNVMILFQVLSVYYLIKYTDLLHKKDLRLSLLFLAISFVVLQKTIFFFAAYGVGLLFLVYLKKVFLLDFIKNSLFFFFPILVYFLFLFWNGSLYDYWITNWILNLKMSSSVNIGSQMNYIDTAFLLISAATIFYLFTIKFNWKITLIIIFALITLSNVLLVPFPHGQYFLPSYPYLSIVVVYGLQNILSKYSNRNFNVLLFGLLFFLLIFNVKQTFESNTLQMKEFDYSMAQTKPDDIIVDGWATFNFFRYDIHYFWFSLNKGMALDTYQKLFPNKKPYDLMSLVKSKKPRIITHSFVDMNDDFVKKHYVSQNTELFWMKFYVAGK